MRRSEGAALGVRAGMRGDAGTVEREWRLHTAQSRLGSGSRQPGSRRPPQRFDGLGVFPDSGLLELRRCSAAWR